MGAIIAHPKETREQAKALFLQGLTPSRIEQMIGVKRTTIGKWSERGQWMALRDGTTRILVARGTTALLRESSKQLTGASDRIKALLASQLEACATVLEQQPITKASQLANTPAGQGRASVLKTIAEASGIVLDWKSSSNPGLVLCDLLNSEREQPGSTIEIAAEAEALPCGIDATTGSVPDPKPVDPIPQDEQTPSPLIDHPPAD